ncbi:hypothetical protein [Caballeronia grimmiae]|uniref:hypothetical protein n=1 Tax=Caballeronia grimmiae TaxID=1071679 RepID=UPI0038B7FBB5
MFTDDIEATYELTDVESVIVSQFANRFFSNREVVSQSLRAFSTLYATQQRGQMGNRRAPKLLQATLRIG